MSRRKISSESFSSLGSDCPETSPEEEGECPLSRLCWNGSRSPPGPADTPFTAAAAAAAAASAGARRAPRRRRVNLDSLGESIRRLTAPAVSARPRPPRRADPALLPVAAPRGRVCVGKETALPAPSCRASPRHGRSACPTVPAPAAGCQPRKPAGVGSWQPGAGNRVGRHKCRQLTV